MKYKSEQSAELAARADKTSCWQVNARPNKFNCIRPTSIDGHLNSRKLEEKVSGH